MQGGQGRLLDDYRYFFFITNEREKSAVEIVFSANDRCNQENLHAQLKGGVRALHARVDNLTGNWAYMQGGPPECIATATPRRHHLTHQV